MPQGETLQEVIPGMEQYVRLPSTMEDLVERNPKIAFGRVVMPYFFNLDIEDYKDTPQSHIEAAQPEKFLPYLLPASRRTEGSSVDGVPLPPEEFERIVRSPDAFVKKIGTTTLKARQLDQNRERRQDAADRSEIHALTPKYQGMERTLRGIEAEQHIIGRLQKEAHSPGYAHVRAQDMLSMAAYAHTQIFGRILEVVGAQKQWTNDQARDAEKALNYRLFFTGRERVGNWRSMLRVAELYGEKREDLFKDRLRRVGSILVANNVSIEEITK